MRVVDRQQDLSQAGGQLSQVALGLPHEVGHVQSRGCDRLDLADDDLQRPLIKLRLAPDLHEIAGVDVGHVLLGHGSMMVVLGVSCALLARRISLA